jgi:thioredoxin 1
LGAVRDVTGSEFDKVVLGSQTPIAVDFWAPWCRPCKAVESILEELPVDVARVNIDEEPALASRYDVLSIPTVILFAGGEARGKVIGARPRAHFDAWLAEVLPAG